MVVDEEEIILEVTAVILQELGYEVIMANEGHQAIKLYQKYKNKISLVVLDIVMPHVSGEQVFHALSAINPAVKVILISGYDKQERSAAMLSRGCLGFLKKPFYVPTLEQTLQKAFSKLEA